MRMIKRKKAPMHSKIKILFFCDNKWGGGILTYLYNLISGLDRDIFEITLVCSKPETGSIYMIDEIKKLGVEVIPYEHLRFIALFFGVLKFFFKKRFDIFSLHTWSHELVLASKLAMVKLVIFHPHEYYYLKINKLRRRLIDKLARHCLDAIVVPSKLNIPPIVKAYRIPSSRLFVIPHGINTQVFIKKYDKQYYRRKTNLDCPHCLIGTVALLSEIKGYPYLLEAIAILKKKGVWLKLVIAGDTRPQLSTAARLKTISNTLGIKDDIVFLGFRRDVVDILGAIDIFVLPSLEELFGLAILEAMAMSKPIIATNTGGVPELIIDNETGILVPPGDSNSMAEAIYRLIKNPEVGERMGTKARKRVEELFSQENMVNKTKELYIDLLQNSYL